MRKRFLALIGTLLLLGSLAIAIPYLNTLSNKVFVEFEWGVGVGDVFIYKLQVIGGKYSGHDDLGGPPDYVEFNETTIQVSVFELPELPTVTNNDAFLKDVVQTIKVNCTFYNSSAISEPVNTMLCKLLSWTLLPIGSWDAIYSMYSENDWDDMFENEDVLMCYVEHEGEMFDFTLHIQKDWLHAIGEGWNGRIDLSTGLPLEAVYEEYQFSCDGSGEAFGLHLILLN
ncbi:MAG: hypothetical protein ACXADC_14345 [Candidatus Thorarchaeota archaeon]|jgi:hypothetical protein